jgi:ABC-type branched-subunit amino acid transport system ATPase component
LVESEVEQLKELLLELKRAGQSMLIIEHLLSVLFGLSDRIVVLNFGECIATGTPATVIHDPVVVEAYLGKEHAGGTIPPLEELHESLTTSEDAANDVAQLEEKSEEQAMTMEEAIGMRDEGASLLHMSQVSAGYGEFQALFDVSLHIQKGEIIALIGLNGAGKTTLIRTLTRRLPLKDGDILFKGKSLAGVPAHNIADLGIAQCLEGRKIFPELTVLENLELGAYCKHARQQRHETLKQVYDLFPILAERRNQLGSTLSGGQQQMLAIGRALMAKPELIIFDEISLGLAPIIIDELYRAIVEINRQGMTILLVEQSVQRSLDIVQRAYVMEHGRMVLSGTAQSLKNNTDFRQAYFGL